MKKFYKVTEITKGSHRTPDIKFMRLDDEDKEKLEFIKWSVSSKYMDGADITLVEQTDPDFQRYIKADIIQVQKDIEKLEELKQALKKELL